MARSTKTMPATPVTAPRAPVRAKGRRDAPAPVPFAPAKAKAARAAPAPVVPKTTPPLGRGKQAATSTPAAARIPPPSKGELRAQIAKLETANAALKAKGRESNRAAKAATRHIAELEEQVTQLREQAAGAPAPVAPAAKAKTVRSGRTPGRKKAIDRAGAVPPGVAVEEAEPMDAEAKAARDALEDNLSGE